MEEADICQGVEYWNVGLGEGTRDADDWTCIRKGVCMVECENIGMGDMCVDG